MQQEYYKEVWLDNQHWTDEYYVQRLPTKQWRQILLNNDDSLIFNGRMTKLVGKNIGFGVIEVRKEAEGGK